MKDIKKALLKLNCSQYLSETFKKEAVPVQIAIWNDEKQPTLFGKIVAVRWETDEIGVWDDENILGSNKVTIIDIMSTKHEREIKCARIF
jgi:hypothetical protein